MSETRRFQASKVRNKGDRLIRLSTIRYAFVSAPKPSAARERSSSKAGAGGARWVLLAAAVLLLAGAGRLPGATITAEAVPPKPGQENFRHLWNVTLHNPKPDTSSVSFRVEAREAKIGVVFSASTRPILLAPGERRLTAADIKLIDVSGKKGYEAFTSPDKGLPEGDYSYIITLVPGMRQSAFFLRVRVPKPVELAWPPDGAVVGDTEPVFVWKPPVAPGPNVAYQYTLRVAEVGRGQTGAVALKRNRPVFEERRLRGMVGRAPAGVFAPGRTYAWGVGVTDTAGVSVDSANTQSEAGLFVYKPGAGQMEARTSFTYPKPGRAVTGNASLVVASDIPDAEYCVLEYSLDSDSARGDWKMVGSFPKGHDSFVGMWASDSAVMRAGMTFPASGVVRATVLGRRGQRGEALLSLVINPPPAPTRKGCGGCNQHPDE
jgi:hypothetical protein